MSSRDQLTDPERIGPYRILRRIGEGGMGIVYEAEQIEPVRRRVALKVIRAGMDTASVVTRFEAERQALAVMDHPNIARMLDAGATEDRRPYFVMEMVQGESITQYCDRHKLRTEDRVRLFTHVCNAVQHAHAKGVIHRDIKPSNILVEISEGRAIPKIIDFGIAKAIGMGLTDNTLVTRLGQVLGTPAYMSPEQAEKSELDIDTRTDVYSLGVVLYELLVGSLPFDRGLFAQPDFVFQYLLRDREAPTPSARLGALLDTQHTVARNRATEVRSLRRQLRGDLDWIVMQAMQKDRTQRYETPAAFAHDLDRFLERAPVEARPPSFGYRSSRFVRRHRVGVSMAAGISALLLGSSAMMSLQSARLAEERDTAEAVSGFLEELFEATDPFQQNGEDRDTLSISDFVRIGAEKVQSDLADQPSVKARLALVLGKTFRNLGNYDDAERLAAVAVDTYTDLLGDEAGETLASRQQLAFILEERGEPDRAVEIFEDVRRIRTETEMPHDEAYGDALSGLGNAYQGAGDFPAAEQAYRDAIIAYDGAADAGTTKRAQGRANLATALIRMARPEEAEPLLRDAITSASTELSEDHPTLITFQNNLAYVLEDVKRFDEAQTIRERTLELSRQRFPSPHPQIARQLNNLGSLYLIRGEPAKAEPWLVQATDMRRDIYGSRNPNVAVSLHNLAGVYRRLGRLSEAWAGFAEATEILEMTLGPEHPRVATSVAALGRVRVEQERLDEAVAHYRRAEAIRETALGEDHPLLASLRVDLGTALVELGRYPEAEAVLVKAHRGLQPVRDTRSANWKAALAQLVTLNSLLGKADEAALYQAQLDIAER